MATGLPPLPEIPLELREGWACNAWNPTITAVVTVRPAGVGLCHLTLRGPSSPPSVVVRSTDVPEALRLWSFPLIARWSYWRYSGSVSSPAASRHYLVSQTGTQEWEAQLAEFLRRGPLRLVQPRHRPTNAEANSSRHPNLLVGSPHHERGAEAIDHGRPHRTTTADQAPSAEAHHLGLRPQPYGPLCHL